MPLVPVDHDPFNIGVGAAMPADGPGWSMPDLGLEHMARPDVPGQRAPKRFTWTDFWPVRMAQDIGRGFALGGDVAAGKFNVEPERPGYLSEVDVERQRMHDAEVVNRASNLAGALTYGSYGVPAGAVGSGIARKAAPLPMDTASRMARARQLGFNVDEPLYHGTGAEFKAFDPRRAGSASGAPEQQAAFFSPSGNVASHYAKIASVRDVLPGEVPHQVWDYMGKTYSSVYDGARVYPAYVKPGKQLTVDIPYYNTAEVNAAIQKAQKKGYDTVRFKNMADTGAPIGEGRMDQIAVLNPANVRSQFAAFDPANKDSGFLLGSGATDKRTAGIVAGLNAARASEQPAGIRAYHGSPYDFDRFDMSKIGTGEGAQAYGHGLYFAENEATAKAYRDQVKNMALIDAANKRLSDIAREMDTLAVPGKYRQFRDPRGYALADEYDALMAEKMKPGRMYEVNIAAKPEQFLDWDRPVAMQPAIQEAIGEIARANKGWLPTKNNKLRSFYYDRAAQADTGADAYLALALGLDRSNLSAGHKVQKYATDALRDAGIPGIRYLDQGSRAAGEGSRNYVVFDDSLISILRKYGLAGLSLLPPAVAAAVSQRVKPVDHDPFAEGL